jgi:WD40 repeat protein
MVIGRNAVVIVITGMSLLASSCAGASPDPGITRATATGLPPADSGGVETVDGARIRRDGGWIFDVDFSPDGKSLAAATRAGVTAYRVDSFQAAFFVETQYLPTCIDYSGDGKKIAYGTDVGEVRVIGAQSGEAIQTIAADNSRINDLAFSPDGKWLAAGRADHSVVLWDAATGGRVRTLEGHEFQVDSVSFSPDGQLLAAGAVAGSMMDEGVVIIVWNTLSGKVVSRMTWQPSALPVTPPAAVFFLPDGKQAASLSTDGMLFVWDARTGKKKSELKLEFPAGGNSFGLSGDGAEAAVGAVSGDIFLFDAGSGDRIRLTEGLPALSAVECMDFSPDGRMLASGTVNGALMVWDLTHWR